jgi:hypothetical protein
VVCEPQNVHPEDSLDKKYWQIFMTELFSNNSIKERLSVLEKYLCCIQNS